MLDTDICIFYRSRRSKPVVGRVERLHVGEAVMSVVSYGELRAGAEKNRDRHFALDRVEVLAEVIGVLPLPRDAAVHYADIRAHLERRGEIIGSNDLWIAAHERAADLTLVTNNEREFRRVPDLRVENWAAEEA